MTQDQAPSPIAAAKKRADRAWLENAAWDELYRDAYDFAIPNRKPGGIGKSKRVADRLFDMTAPTSAMNLAGTLQRLLFSRPPKLEPGALVKQALTLEGPQGLKKLEQLTRILEKTGEFIYPFMQAGDLDTSTHELCIDLGVGTGVLIPMRGTPEQPIIFFSPPSDECAFACDAFGRINFMSWKRSATREQILASWPKGNFSTEFRTNATKAPDTETVIYQDFWKRDDGMWQFGCYMERECETYISTEIYRTKPFASPRYYRVSGETRGRGPILLALPTIKTVNKAQELALKAAAIQMLGIWGYRAGSSFNPDTAPMAPGAFWSMDRTGGITGPDIQRLDPASGRLDVASMVIEGSQQQVRDALMDTRLPPQSGTPRSASEIAATLRQNANVHLGGYMRLWRELHPEILPRCAEILHSFQYLAGLMDFNQLITSVGMQSPMAAALSAEEIQNIANYAELVTAMVGPAKLPEHLVIDDATDRLAAGLFLPRQLIPSAEDKAAIRQALAQQQAQAVEAEAMVKAAPQIAGGAMRVIEGGKAAA